MQIYIVSAGDTVTSIAARHGLPAEQIISDNDLPAPYNLAVGQTLVLQFPAQTYIVKSGDTLYNIAVRNGTMVNALYRNNPSLKGSPHIMPGQQLVLRYEGAQNKQGRMFVNGYAYPFITEETLRRTLPYLSALTIFSYNINPNGSLVPINDTPLITMAKEYNVMPLMHVSNIGASETFESSLASALLNSSSAQDAFVENVVRIVNEKGYGGVDFDFEYVYAADKDAFTALVARVSSILNPMGKEVVVALAPKTNANQSGLLFEGHDYPGMGRAANLVLLMTYEWGYSYGPPMAVAPLPQVSTVLDYAVSTIPRNKILMGIPAYGYDWKLPYEANTRAPSIYPQDAQNLAVERRAEITYDSVSGAPNFNYWQGSGRHVVWYEDARSIEAKLSMATRYGLRGISYWTIMRYFPQNWLVLNALYDIEKVF